MGIAYYRELPLYIKQLKTILGSEEIKKGQIEIKLGSENLFNYVRSLSPELEKIGDEKLSILKQLGLEPLNVPFQRLNTERSFKPGEMVSADEVKQAYEALENYNTIQSIREMQDEPQRKLLENILYGAVTEAKR